MNNGYLEISCAGHERANPSNGFVYVHVLEAEKKIGRKLKSHEHVHHKDGDKTNNSHDNLMVLFDASDHSRVHCGFFPIKRLDGSYTTVESRYRVNKYWIKTWYGPKHLPTKIKWPDLEELISLLKQSNFLQVGKKLGVSDNAIRKHLRYRGVDPKTLTMIE